MKTRLSNWLDAGIYVVVALMTVAYIAIILFCDGCCWTAKRDCFPACPPPTVVPVDKPCMLPLKPTLPDVVVLQPGDICPLPLTCFDPQNAKLLALRESRMKLWIREALAACPQAMPAASRSIPVLPTSKPIGGLP